MSNCPCTSGLPFENCCAPYLDGGRLPPTSEALMRSRFTAYAKRDTPYLLRTWHNSTRPTEEEFSAEGEIDWTGLDILRTENGGPADSEGEVEFVAHYRSSSMDCTLHEISQFVKEGEQWYYVDGEIQPQQPVRSAKIGRNEPCPCGSGKKYKKCCHGH